MRPKAAGFEAVLLKLQIGLSKPRGTRDLSKIMERLARARQRFARAAQHYQVEIAKDDTATNVSAITWSRRVKPGSAAMHPGVYCLRTSLVGLDDATLWRTYTMLTDLESVFRSIKTDLGLRPVFHQIDRRVEGHLFISVLAYHFVHLMRTQLKGQGIDDSWSTLRQTLAVQQRVTITLQRRDGRTVHVLIWFMLAMSATLAMMLAHRLFVAMDQPNPTLTATHATGTALPLLVFLLAYVVGWSRAATAGTHIDGRWFRHVIASALIAAWTTAYDPSKAAVSVALYLFCAACVELLRRFAPLPANATMFQIVQAAGGVCGGWFASYMQ